MEFMSQKSTLAANSINSLTPIGVMRVMRELSGGSPPTNGRTT